MLAPVASRQAFYNKHPQTDFRWHRFLRSTAIALPGCKSFTSTTDLCRLVTSCLLMQWRFFTQRKTAVNNPSVIVVQTAATALKPHCDGVLSERPTFRLDHLRKSQWPQNVPKFDAAFKLSRTIIVSYLPACGTICFKRYMIFCH